MKLSYLRSMVDDLLCDGSIGLLDDFVDMLRSLNGVWLVVNPLELLKGTSLHLNTTNELAGLFL